MILNKTHIEILLIFASRISLIFTQNHNKKLKNNFGDLLGIKIPVNLVNPDENWDFSGNYFRSKNSVYAGIGETNPSLKLKVNTNTNSINSINQFIPYIHQLS